MNLNTWDQPAKATDRACERWSGWRAVSGAINDRRTERNKRKCIQDGSDTCYDVWFGDDGTDRRLS